MGRGGGAGGLVWLQFQAPLDFLLLRESLSESRGDVLLSFFPPPNDESQCFPDMTHISKTDV